MDTAFLAERMKTREKARTNYWSVWRTADDWPHWLTVREGASYLGISADLLRDLILPGRDGRAEISSKKIGSIYRVAKIELDRYGITMARSQQ